MSDLLDFEVQPTKVFYPSTRPFQGLKQAEKKQAIVRSDTDDCLAIVSDRYQIIQNKEYFPLVDEAVKSFFPEEDLQIKDRLSYKGKYSGREYVVKSVKGDLPVEAGDTTFRLYARNSHGAGSLKLFSGLMDVLCANLELWRYNQADVHSLFLRHTKKAKDEIKDRAFQAMEAGVSLFKAKNVEYTRWADTKVSSEKVEKYFSETFSPRAAIELQGFYDTEVERRGRNLWAVASALTGYATHGRFRGGETARENVQFQRQLHMSKLMESRDFRQLGKNSVVFPIVEAQEVAQI